MDNKMKSEILIVLLSDVIRKRVWLYNAGIPQSIYARLSQTYEVLWHHREPSSRYPHVEHRSYVPIGLKEEIFEMGYSPLRRVRDLLK